MGDTTNIPINAPPIPPEQEVHTPSIPPVKKSPSILLIIAFFLLLLVSIFLYLLFFTSILDSLDLVKKEDQLPLQQQQKEQEEDSNPKEYEQKDEKEESISTFKGETITAVLPEGWSIKEYYDGQGTDMLTEGISYKGLTGLKIFRNDIELFSMEAVYGIGFAGCPNYAKFTDENIAYYNQIIEDNKVSETELEVKDYTKSQYMQFDWLGKTFRRIEKEYTYDSVENNQYFEPSCVPTLVTFNGVEFIPEGSPSATAYHYSPTKEATLEDLGTIDNILESMELIN